MQVIHKAYKQRFLYNLKTRKKSIAPKNSTNVYSYFDSVVSTGIAASPHM